MRRFIYDFSSSLEFLKRIVVKSTQEVIKAQRKDPYPHREYHLKICLASKNWKILAFLKDPLSSSKVPAKNRPPQPASLRPGPQRVKG